MLNIIWTAVVLLSTVFMTVTGNVDGYIGLVSEGLEGALELCLSLAGIMAFWGGMMEIAERSELTSVFAKALSPVLRPIFPEIKGDKEALKGISMNITANLLGLGNAATPLGLKAMERLDRLNSHNTTASDSMVTFVIINTASVQLIPVTTAALRAKYGSDDPMSILPAVLLASVLSLAVGLTVDRLMKSFRRSAL